MAESDKELLERMIVGWNPNRPRQSPCGDGSEPNKTRNIRKWLPEIIEKYDIEILNDAGAGDLKWIQLIDWDIDYKGYDLYPRHEAVEQIDITKEIMRPCDAILCRMVLVHLDKERVLRALENFRKCAKYLIVTHYHSPMDCRLNYDDPFHHTVMTDDEFKLGEILESIEDTNEYNDLALFKL